MRKRNCSSVGGCLLGVVCVIVYVLLHSAHANSPIKSRTYQLVDYRRGSDASLELRGCGGGVITKPKNPARQRNPAQIVSAILYMNEESLLYARFLELYHVVDIFVIMESPFTFQGAGKPLHFQQEACSRFAQFLDKVVHVIDSFNRSSMPNTGASDAWNREHASRVGFDVINSQSAQHHLHLSANAAQQALSMTAGLLDLQPDDMFLINDADEIPTAAAVQLGANYLQNGLASTSNGTVPIVGFQLQGYVYSLHHTYGAAQGVKMFHYRSISVCTLQEIKHPTGQCVAKVLAVVTSAGIHASYFHTPQNIALKIRSYAHREFNNPDSTNITAIRDRIRSQQHPDGQGKWADGKIQPSNPHMDLQVMAFCPAARAILLAQSRQLHYQQEIE